jgi:hypothetical protein
MRGILSGSDYRRERSCADLPFRTSSSSCGRPARRSQTVSEENPDRDLQNTYGGQGLRIYALDDEVRATERPTAKIIDIDVRLASDLLVETAGNGGGLADYAENVKEGHGPTSMGALRCKPLKWAGLG